MYYATGIFIRAQVNGEWGTFDIGDPQLPDEQVVAWLYDDPSGSRPFNTLMMVLNRSQRESTVPTRPDGAP